MHTQLCLRVTALVFALGATTGCGEAFKDDPEGHAALLETAAGVAAMELVITPDLWERTAHPGFEDQVTVTDPGQDLAERGLMLHTLTGAQLVSYLDHLEGSAYGGWLEQSVYGDPTLSKRLYGEIALIVAEVDGPRGPEDPAPRLVLDETITDGA